MHKVLSAFLKDEGSNLDSLVASNRDANGSFVGSKLGYVNRSFVGQNNSQDSHDDGNMMSREDSCDSQNGNEDSLKFREIAVGLYMGLSYAAIILALLNIVLCAITGGIEVSKLKSEEASIIQKYNSLRSILNTFQQQIEMNSSEIASKLQEHNDFIQIFNQYLTHLHDNNISPKLNSSLQTLLRDFRLGERLNPLSSCLRLYTIFPYTTNPGYYWVRAYNGSAVRVYCDNAVVMCGSRGWVKVAELNMTNTSQECPGDLVQSNGSNPRTCVSRLDYGCSSISFSTSALHYSSVCGRITGYQIGATGTFNRAMSPTIHDSYVDGVSLTHGQRRKHIWSFAAGRDEIGSELDKNCPCINSGTSTPPLFVENDYFCDTGSGDQYVNGHFYNEDPLWDGAGCGPHNTCCSFNDPPWFYKRLSHMTTDDIEMRLCRGGASSNKNVAIEHVEIFVR